MRRAIVSAVIFSAIFSAFVVHATDRKEATAEETTDREKWEYLVVSGANNTNLKPTSTTTMRKEATGAFGQESFVLEQQMDKLGAHGWELVSVGGSPSNPTSYLKRRKHLKRVSYEVPNQ